MTQYRYILKSLLHYAKLNTATVLGIALSTAILVGALIIGDSVKYSLQQITIERLGNTDAVITAGERLFTQDLAENINKNQGFKTSSLLRANGITIVDGGQTRVNQIQVWGVNNDFASFSKAPEFFDLKENEVLINKNLADILLVKTGDEFLLRVNKLSTFPSNTPFVSADETSISFRVKLKAILNSQQTGNFNLQNIQSAPRNIFVNSAWLNRQLGLENKANVIVLNGDTRDVNIDSLLKRNWSVEDLNLGIRQNKDLGYSEIISDRVFIAEETESSCMHEIPGAVPVFSYFVNQFELRGRHTPYSFVSSQEGLSGNEMIINKWLADDLKAKKGDTIRVKYFEVGPLRKLIERDTIFVIKQIVPLQGKWADAYLMPEIPGLSDAGHCRDWETGVPVNLDKVRPVDEEYWNKYKGTPKAFVALETAQKLWANRFGKATAIRFPLQEKEKLAKTVLAALSAGKTGFQLQEVRSDGMYAASNGVDFGGLFIGLSFFVLIAAVLLTILLFRLALGFRQNEVGTLLALGFSGKQIRNIFLTEASVLILAGVVAGIPFGIAYNKLILQAVNSIWVDIVRTSIVYIHIRFSSVLLGAVVIFVLSVLLIYWIIKNFLKREITDLQKLLHHGQMKHKLIWKWLGTGMVAGAVLYMMIQGINKGEINPQQFFISGFLLMPGLTLLFNDLLYSLGGKIRSSGFNMNTLLKKRIAGNRRQNILIVSFLSIGVFLVVSTGVNRKNLTKDADKNFSGTGGYKVFAETTIPVLEDMNDPKVADQYGFEGGLDFVQFRVKPGDDASCLNLNRISRPRIIGFDPAVFNKRKAYTFITKTGDLDENNSWLSLENLTAEGYVPAIADQTVIKWGLGKNVGDTLVYQNEKGEKLKLKLIGGLANSVFQGNILIDEKFFIANYPSVSGSNLLLVDSQDQQVRQIEEELQQNLRAFGIDTTPTAQRLLEFYTIENTYLNIFLMLGALGLLIGTIGLGILIFRMVTEKRREFAVMLALGFSRKQIYRLVFVENLTIIIIALLVGLIPSVVSAIPSATTEVYKNLIWWPFVISLLVFVSAFIWMIISIRMALSKNLVPLLRNE